MKLRGMISISGFITSFLIWGGIVSCTSGAGNSSQLNSQRSQNQLKNQQSFPSLLTPMEQYAYTISPQTNLISVYRKDNVSGALSKIKDITTISSSSNISLDLKRFRIYTVNAENNTISLYKIESNTGNLLPLKTPTVATGNAPIDIKVAPSGQYVYVLNEQDNNIYTYLVNSPGSSGASLIFESSVLTGKTPLAMAIHPLGRWLYAINTDDNTISIYTVESGTGAIIPQPTTGTVINPSTIKISSSGNYLYILSQYFDSLAIYQINFDGSLTPLPGSAGVTGINFPSAIVFDPTNTYAYITNVRDNSIAIYKVSNGMLNYSSSITTGSDPTDITFDGQGKNVYVTSQSNTILAY